MLQEWEERLAKEQQLAKQQAMAWLKQQEGLLEKRFRVKAAEAERASKERARQIPARKPRLFASPEIATCRLPVRC